LGAELLRAAFAVGLLMFLSPCTTTQSSAIYGRGVVEGPRVVALVGPRYAWTAEIEKRLREKGYAVKRFASVVTVTEQVSANRSETYREAVARVALRVDGYAPNTAMTRCFGGGFQFDSINAEVIDLKNNETLATYSNSGYSENCPPLSGKIFTDIVRMVDAVFK
jgi:hypothetical protein